MKEFTFKITLLDLRRMGACKDQRKLFAATFGRECLWNRENVILALKAKINVTWFAQQIGFRGIDLSDANLSRADLSDADLRDANLRSADLSDADLRDANLSVANLYHADLSVADLRGADLSSADLNRADLSSANLRSADLRGVDLRGAKYSDFTQFPVSFQVPETMVKI